ncbi:MAG: hypothetical protein L0H41_17470 [Microlunatus sp.]|nr:hypothetical protein [Microlunatus sp.]
MPHAAATAVTGVLILAASIWLGGYVALIVVSRVATRTMDPATRSGFFRELGRTYGLVTTIALLVAYACGVALLFGRPWDGVLVATVVIAIALAAVTAVGVVQARGMGRLRRRARGEPGDLRLAEQVRRGARRATALRALIGVLSLGLLALGVMLGGA